MKRFLDSNVFLYAFLNQDVGKKTVAARILAEAVREDNGYVSLQVAKEFCNVMIKRSGKPVDEIAKASEILDRYHLVDGSMRLIRRALEFKGRYDIQFYDSLMLAAAEAGGCGEIYTEDLNDGQVYFGIKAVNPFR